MNAMTSSASKSVCIAVISLLLCGQGNLIVAICVVINICRIIIVIIINNKTTMNYAQYQNQQACQGRASRV